MISAGVDIGSTTFRTAAADTAASTASPPARKASKPASVASGWLVATIPPVLRTTERRDAKSY